MKSILSSILCLVLICYANSAALDSTGANNDCDNHRVNNIRLRLTPIDSDKAHPGDPIKFFSEDYGQHILCLFKEKDIISVDGKIQKDVVRNKAISDLRVGAEDVGKAEDCAIQKDGQKETAIAFYNCVAPLVSKHNPSKTLASVLASQN
ncbi:uncharacterized protein LOC123315646 [Coccinella septempunctata]|uniref:uncharacterized protein LOC123315646 n=1 Tax=Coccinella septempunctata TaxID=41139 RepID=UPI001D064E24|nr:uncharacterized protein LOC123315646 [Coccinella septempunctata]